MQAGDGRICIIDDDSAIRESLRLLLYSENFVSDVYSSADEFLSTEELPDYSCMLLDIRMPGTDGNELFQQLIQKRVPYPIIFITGHGDIPLAVSAIKQGAFDFLTKPFGDGELLAKVNHALEHFALTRSQAERISAIRNRIDLCTPREQEVLYLMARGYSTKGIAEALEISPRTVEIHRSHVMEKMEAESLPELVRMIAAFEA